MSGVDHCVTLLGQVTTMTQWNRNPYGLVIDHLVVHVAYSSAPWHVDHNHRVPMGCKPSSLHCRVSARVCFKGRPNKHIGSVRAP